MKSSNKILPYTALRYRCLHLAAKHNGNPSLFNYWMKHYDKLLRLTLGLR